ncbi:MAG: DUF2085 domain-containing protein [Patescibacteria group bacterium]|nr:DUF2085 domain-containing protein [Patescibacteria group bacterium]MDE1944850.1 DUF2085 domain-containing protein [Patescibacteria group bacterium]MDE2057296.1 DUF2085 domain-containing protein [Patescibacteria group bacterium]
MPEVQQDVVIWWRRLKNLNFGCHGIPERCLCVNGKRMRICARCFGANIGHIVSIVLFLTGHLPQLWVSAALVAVMLLDWSLQAYANIPSTNTRRVITGFAGGLGIGSILWRGIGIMIGLLVGQLGALRP